MLQFCDTKAVKLIHKNLFINTYMAQLLHNQLYSIRSGGFMRKCVFLLILLSWYSFSIASVFRVTNKSTNGIDIEFSCPGFSIDNKTDKLNWNTSDELSPSAENTWSKLIIVPRGYKLTSNIVSTKSSILPSAVIESDSSSAISVHTLGIMRGVRLAAITIKPLAYVTNSGEKELLKSASISIKFVPDSDYPFSREIPLLPSWEQYLSSEAINPEVMQQRLSPHNGSYLIFYNGDPVIYSALQTLIKWKQQLGFDVKTVSILTIGANTAAIKNYIQNAYNQWDNPPAYILLAGDPDSQPPIPTYFEHYEMTTAGDYNYTLLEGNDIVPDAEIGRLPFTEESELKTIINRIIMYERGAGLSTTNWFENTALVGDASNSGESTQLTMQYIKGLIQGTNNSQAFTEIYSGDFPSLMNSAINNGTSALFYRGFYGLSGWTNSSVSSLINQGKYPFVTLVTCDTGLFANYSQTSVAEKLLLVGTPANPRGAIGSVGTSCETHTCFNDLFTAALAFSLYGLQEQSLGAAMNFGRISLQRDYPSNPAQHVNQYCQAFNLFGDPSIQLWRKHPTALAIALSDTLVHTSGSMIVRVTNTAGEPVKDAIVSLMNISQIPVVCYTDQNGYTTLSYENFTSGTTSVTASKNGFFPVVKTLTYQSIHPSFAITSFEHIQQPIVGHTGSLRLKVKNTSGQAFTTVNVTIQSLSPALTILTESCSISNWQNQAELWLPTTINYSLGSNLDFGEELLMKLQFTPNIGIPCILPYSLQESSPLIKVSSITVNNTLSYIPLSAGSTIQINLRNEGSSPLQNATYSITSMNSLISANTVSGAVTIQAGDTTSITVTGVTPASTVIPGFISGWKVNLHYATGDQEIIGSIPIGYQTPTDPTGPDSYGYLCYSSYDTGYANHPTYNWVEINPTLGGNGTSLNLSDTDLSGGGDSEVVSLPFAFKFYGKYYTEATISSNGAIQLGRGEFHEWMNRPIPDPITPLPLIAPFWDDLLTSYGGNVYILNDTANHRFIVQWDQMALRYDTNVTETFQAIIYDASYYPSANGASSIKIQYKDISDIDEGTYGQTYVDHGQYSTVGIASDDRMTGLQYIYDNNPGNAGHVLASQTALLFNPTGSTSNIPIISAPILQLTEVTGNNDGIVNNNEVIDIKPKFFNIGTMNLPATTIQIASDDPYIQIMQGSIHVNTILAGDSLQTTEAFQVKISDACPHMHQIRFTFSSPTTSEFVSSCINISAPDIVLQSVSYHGLNTPYPLPGSSFQLSLSFYNNSEVPLQNAMISVVGSPYIQSTPINSFNFPTSAISTVTYPITTAANTPLGEVMNLSVQIKRNDVIITSIPITVLVGKQDTLIFNNFNDNSNLVGWNLTSNVSVDSGHAIDQTGNELAFHYGDGVVQGVVSSPIFSSYDIQHATLSFKYLCLLPNYTLYVHLVPQDDPIGTIVYTVKDTPTQGIENITIDIDSIPMVAAGYCVTIFGVAQSPLNQETPIFIDDISLTAIRHALATISGQISVIGNSINLTALTVSGIGFEDTVHPDANGYYSMSLPQGEYVDAISVSGPDCYTYRFPSINLTSGQSYTNINASIYYLRKPINLTHTIAGNIIYLHWALDGIESEESLQPTYYRVVLRRNNFTLTSNSDSTGYSHLLYSNSRYKIWVQAVYQFGENEFALSDSSEVIEFVFVPNEEEHVSTIVNNLNQNYPNPFNPTTDIRFSLRDSNKKVSLMVYNIKGQKVKEWSWYNTKGGSFHCSWDGKNEVGEYVASGTYFYRLKGDHYSSTRKMLLLK